MLLPPLIDLHEDISLYYVSGGAGQRFPYDDFSKDVERRHGDIPKFRRAKVRLVFAAIAPLTYTISHSRTEQRTKGYGTSFRALQPKSSTLLALQHISTYYHLAKMHPNDIKLVFSETDLNANGEDEAIRFLLALEGAEPLEDVDDLNLFYQLGLRSLQLTWNFDNRYAASCMSQKDYGLTGDGEELVRLCNELGVIVDLSHASKKTVLEAVSASRLPLIASHANAKAVRNHARNLDDDELDAIKRNGGVVGVTLIGPTISPKPSLTSLVDHIMYIYENFGEDILAVGTDFFGLLDVAEPTGLESITKLKNLWAALRDMELQSSVIEKLAYRNALRVLEGNSSRWTSR